MPEATHVSYTCLEIKVRFMINLPKNIVFISETKVVVEIKGFTFHSFMTCFLKSMGLDFEFSQRENNCETSNKEILIPYMSNPISQNRSMAAASFSYKLAKRRPRIFNNIVLKKML